MLEDDREHQGFLQGRPQRLPESLPETCPDNIEGGSLNSYRGSPASVIH